MQIIIKVSIEEASKAMPSPTRISGIRQLNDVPLPIGFLESVRRHGSRVEIFRNEKALLNFLIGNQDFLNLT